ncbi:hypothetical protein AVEN_84090-1 [Araneus ventricosus]|uniref:Uncharacterized protein n=1 Tax=Araneus ventricosus TaxID=182803 RepID=A0A4Y2J4R9_ARAVE|nr:hypothetical protein AVEN_84090-1 [Araneus ventricosus]
MWITILGYFWSFSSRYTAEVPEVANFLLHKFGCHHSTFRKVPKNQNKRGISKNSNCPATITIKFKLDTQNAKKKDENSKENIIKPKVSTMNPSFPDLVGNSLESHSRHLSPYLSAMQQTANTEDEEHFSSFIEVLHSCNDKFGSSTSGLRKITERL